MLFGGLFAVGHAVSMVRTIDQENDIITYSIEPGKFRDGSNFFEIDEKTGLITIRKSLQGQVRRNLYFYLMLSMFSSLHFIH